MWKEKKPDAIVIMLYIRDEIVCKTIQTLRFFVNCQKFDSKSCDLWRKEEQVSVVYGYVDHMNKGAFLLCKQCFKNVGIFRIIFESLK